MVGLSGLEPPTSRLSGVRSNQLSYRPIIFNGAGDGNRTHDNSLEGCGFTTKLHPQYIKGKEVLIISNRSKYYNVYFTMKVVTKTSGKYCSITCIVNVNFLT